MKSIYKILFSALLLICTSCTDVIDVDVPEGPIKLVIEASLDWEKGTAGNEQTIKLSTSTPFFDKDGNTSVTGAVVQVTNDNDGTVFIFEDQNDGTYDTSSFIPIIGNSYSLEVIYDGDQYAATETLFSVSDISSITQSTEDGDDEVLEVNVSFQDPAGVENYYFLRFQSRNDLLPELFYIKDEFIDGNEAPFYYEKIEDEEENIEEFKPGDIVDIALLGISEDYYNYLQLLVEQFEGAGDPFSPTPVALVGNCINLTDPDNAPYGYFRVTQKVQDSYTFE
ncbi:DUF4249 domain-containing protein [Flagellimonas eckloniae]|uniref:DUF4249 domain-containing protein n=1 Tax=Flagellimonas eckloniae TaxID=346185 RepID=A0A0Q1H5A9_9FLAO|nr:DUF4249 domain-containing protein [Allomuricauda eckloniae]KQC28720.1 hypothetical protein AAY42_01565 [Allomuricauda eckloniae]